MAHGVRLASVLLLVAGGAAPAAAAPDTPDPGFGGDGTVVLHSDTHSRWLGDMEVLDDGRIMLVVHTGADPAVEVWRLRANGTPDPTFGGGDGVHAFGGAEHYEVTQLVVDPATGKSYVSALVDGVPFPTTVWRLTAAGSPDASFGGGTGHVVFEQRVVEGLTTVPGGKLVMVGGDFDLDATFAWQLTATGAPDPGFGTGGSLVLSADPNNGVGAVLRQPDGKLVVAGNRYQAGEAELRVYRVTRTGVLDPSFSGDGTAVIDPSSPGVTTTTVWRPDVVRRPDGRLVVVAGLNQNNGGLVNTLFLGGLKASGKPDGRFGTRVLSGLTAHEASAVLQRDGRLVVGGLVPPLPSTSGAVARFTPRGTYDPTWSGDGLLPLPGSGDAALGLLPTGRLVAAATVQTGAVYDTHVRAFKGTKVPRCKGRLATQFGTRKADKITGTSGRDVLVGLAGKDKIKGRGGKDLICGNGGRDKLFGGNGRDKIYGQGGNDLLVGNNGKDVLRGGGGKDTIKQ